MDSAHGIGEGEFFITFVNTEFNHRRMLHSGGLAKDDATPDFRFLSISDGLPFSDADATQPLHIIGDGLPSSDGDATQSLHSLCDSCRTYMVQPFQDLMVKLTKDDDVPPVAHIISDGFMNFVTCPAAEKFGVPLVHLLNLAQNTVETMRSHVVCLPVPVQSHIGAMLKVANILHHEGGLFITFVNTEFNHRRMLHSGGLAKDDATPDFRFLSISDGLPFSDADATQPLNALCDSCRTYMVQPFLDLIENLTEDDDVPPVTHILSDGFMNFIASLAAEKFGLQLVHLFPIPACALMAFKHYGLFVKKWLKLSKGRMEAKELRRIICKGWVASASEKGRPSLMERKRKSGVASSLARPPEWSIPRWLNSVLTKVMKNSPSPMP
ncbi:hypothetical protein MLD38_010134 [Melastoma candidum]|uniref:Uncharacterized protein n=1 Tax=Melastoma candidum TaxID=119954 RepID=A0ACB9R0P0_9MYRT|nr:hypothetical protein MLD38_010134 [Melastoma candidum]